VDAVPDHGLNHAVASDAADHLVDARQRARTVLGGESHLAAVDDWRRALVSTRDALILTWLTWVALHGFGDPAFTGLMLVAMAFPLALLVGISTAHSTNAQIRYYASEFERERAEIRDNFEDERAEVSALYAAKGFREPLLSHIVNTLCADDDRLLKVMMEEELGLSMHHMHHPLVVGLWNFGGALLGGLALAIPAVWLTAEATPVWMTGGGLFLLAIVSSVSARVTQKNVVEVFAGGAVTAVVTGGTVYLLSKWLAGFA
jgi:VIT1/CCC1 family predicted Fe2+/Mn2+ transporter